jgi:hypothetical protein
MELRHLRVIVEGLDSLAEIEKEHPVLGAKLLTFVQDVRACCKQAYERLSTALGEVRNLPSKPSPEQLDAAFATINAAPTVNGSKMSPVFVTVSRPLPQILTLICRSKFDTRALQVRTGKNQ